MRTDQLTPPVELIPAQRQVLWGWPAVANFALGGTGAGLYAVAVLASGFERSPVVAFVSWLAPLLVLAGLAAVAGEAGRPLRGPRVLWRVRTSWMSRELWLGAVFVLLVAADIVFPLPFLRAPALAAAVLFALAQGFIVRQARGIPAWDVSAMPWLFLLSAGVSGAGAFLVIEANNHRALAPRVLLASMLLLIVSLWAGRVYVSASGGRGFREATAGLRHGPLAKIIAGGGLLLPLGVLVVALAAPAIAGPAAGLAGALMVAGQVYAKRELILEAGQLRPITVAHLRLSRRSP